MNGLKPIKMPSAKEKVAAELRKAILSRQMKEGEVLSLESVATQLNVSGDAGKRGISDTCKRWVNTVAQEQRSCSTWNYGNLY